MNPTQHRRYLDYIDRFEYFGRAKTKMSQETFVKLDSEYLELLNRKREDEEEVRFAEIANELLRD